MYPLPKRVLEQLSVLTTEGFNPLRHPPQLGRVTVVTLMRTPWGMPVVRPAGADNSQWIFPQGGVKAGEVLSAACRREMREELGIKWEEVEISRDIRCLDFYHSPQAKGGPKLLVGMFVEVASLGRIRRNFENQAVRFVRNPHQLGRLMWDASAHKRRATELFLKRAGLLGGEAWGRPLTRADSPFR